MYCNVSKTVYEIRPDDFKIIITTVDYKIYDDIFYTSIMWKYFNRKKLYTIKNTSDIKWLKYKRIRKIKIWK